MWQKRKRSRIQSVQLNQTSRFFQRRTNFMQTHSNFLSLKFILLWSFASQWTYWHWMTAEESEKIAHKCISECLFKFDMYKFLMMVSVWDHPLRFALQRHHWKTKQHALNVCITMYMSKWIYEISKRCSMCTKTNREEHREIQQKLCTVVAERKEIYGYFPLNRSHCTAQQTWKRLNWRSLNI